MFYERERKTSTYNGNPAEWSGKVGLIYPSDYGYATSGGSTANTANRETCLARELDAWSLLTYYSDCYNNNWLRGAGWTITSYSGYNGGVFNVGLTSVGYANSTNGTNASIKPVIYLKSNIIISGGTGTQTDPFVITE